MRVHLDHHLVCSLKGGVFLLALAVEFNFHAGGLEGEGYEFPNGVGFARGNDKVVGGGLLQHEPHGSDIVGTMPPVAAGIHVAQFQNVLLARFDLCNGNGNFPSYEFRTPAF